MQDKATLRSDLSGIRGYTGVAIAEGRKLMDDPSDPRYSSMDTLKASLEV